MLITEDGEKTYYEEQYESIYEVIRPPESESDFEEIPEEEVYFLTLKCSGIKFKLSRRMKGVIQCMAKLQIQTYRRLLKLLVER